MNKIDFARIDRLVEEFKSETGDRVQRLQMEDRLFKAAQRVGESWSGSCFSPHALLYYGGFRRPEVAARFNIEWGLLHGLPEGWEERTVEEVEKQIQETSGVDLKQFMEDSRALRKAGKELQEEILLELMPLPPEQLQELNNIQWNEAEHSKFLKGQINACPNMSRDFEAISAGRRIPVHTFYEGAAIQARADIEKIDQLVRAIRKIRRAVDVGLARSGTQQEAIGLPAQINVSGPNARINIQSSDKSVNIAGERPDVFGQLQDALKNATIRPDEREKLVAAANDLEADYRKGSFSEAYQRFISTAADHITLIAPFIPALTKLLGG